MATTTIEVKFKWAAVVHTALSTFAANGFNNGNGASKNAEKFLYDMAQILDTIQDNQWLSSDMVDVIEKNRTILKTIERG